MSKIKEAALVIGLLGLFIVGISLPVGIILISLPVWDDPHIQTVKDIRYFQDDRTGICYATLSRRLGRGLAQVPCNSVSPELLEHPTLKRGK